MQPGDSHPAAESPPALEPPRATSPDRNALRSAGIAPVVIPDNVIPLRRAGHFESGDPRGLLAIIAACESVDMDPIAYRSITRGQLMSFADAHPAERDAANAAIRILDRRFGAP